MSQKLLHYNCALFLNNAANGKVFANRTKYNCATVGALLLKKNSLNAFSTGHQQLLFGKLMYCLGTTAKCSISPNVPDANKKVAKAAVEAYMAWDKAQHAHIVHPGTVHPDLYLSCQDFIKTLLTGPKGIKIDVKAYVAIMKGYYSGSQFAKDYTKYISMKSDADAGVYQLLLMGKTVVCLGNLGYDVAPSDNDMNGYYYSRIVSAYNEWADINMPTNMNLADPNTNWSTIFYVVILVMVLILLFVLLSRKGD
jgi:hypothetical protein